METGYEAIVNAIMDKVNDIELNIAYSNNKIELGAYSTVEATDDEMQLN